MFALVALDPAHLAVTPDKQLALGRVDPVPGEGVDLEFLRCTQTMSYSDHIHRAL